MNIVKCYEHTGTKGNGWQPLVDIQKIICHGIGYLPPAADSS